MTNDEKHAPFNGRPPQDLEPETEVEAFEYGFGDTANDVSDMRRLGKKQEFRVRRPNNSPRFCGV